MKEKEELNHALHETEKAIEEIGVSMSKLFTEGSTEMECQFEIDLEEENKIMKNNPNVENETEVANLETYEAEKEG